MKIESWEDDIANIIHNFDVLSSQLKMNGKKPNKSVSNQIANKFKNTIGKDINMSIWQKICLFETKYRKRYKDKFEEYFFHYYMLSLLDNFCKSEKPQLLKTTIGYIIINKWWQWYSKKLLKTKYSNNYRKWERPFKHIELIAHSDIGVEIDYINDERIKKSLRNLILTKENAFSEGDLGLIYKLKIGLYSFDGSFYTTLKKTKLLNDKYFGFRNNSIAYFDSQEEINKHIDKYKTTLEQLIKRPDVNNLDILLLPEYCVPVKQIPYFEKLLATIPNRLGIVVAGSAHCADKKNYFNTAHIFVRDSDTTFRKLKYNKNSAFEMSVDSLGLTLDKSPYNKDLHRHASDKKCIYIIEDHTKGNKCLIVNSGVIGNLSFLICLDLLEKSQVREISYRLADHILIPSLNPGEGEFSEEVATNARTYMSSTYYVNAAFAIGEHNKKTEVGISGVPFTPLKKYGRINSFFKFHEKLKQKFISKHNILLWPEDGLMVVDLNVPARILFALD